MNVLYRIIAFLWLIGCVSACAVGVPGSGGEGGSDPVLIGITPERHAELQAEAGARAEAASRIEFVEVSHAMLSRAHRSAGAPAGAICFMAPVLVDGQPVTVRLCTSEGRWEQLNHPPIWRFEPVADGGRTTTLWDVRWDDYPGYRYGISCYGEIRWADYYYETRSGWVAGSVTETVNFCY